MHTVRILFKDGTFIDVKDVKKWVLDNEFNIFELQKEDHILMIPRDTVKAIGYAEDFRRRDYD